MKNKKLMDNQNKEGYFKKFKRIGYSILFDLPFDNYHFLIKTGKIINYDVEQKKQILYDENNLKLKKLFFSKLITMRPTILDDEDFTEFNNLNRRVKNEKSLVLLGFLGLNSITFYIVGMKKRKFLFQFLLINSFLVIMLYHSTEKMTKFFERMFIKYDIEIVNDELDQKINTLLKKND